MADPEVPPHLFVVFGATGDLMQRKLLPALYHLRAQGRFPAGSLVLGVARHPLDDAAFRESCTRSLSADRVGSDAELHAFASSTLFYFSLSGTGPAGYPGLRARLEQLERDHRLSGNRIFYLALPLEAFGPTLEGLGTEGLANGPGWTRVVIEKPFRTGPRVGRGPECPRPPILHGEADLPHRSLPRQGDGPEPPGLPVRERVCRVRLEPRPRGGHRDHRGGEPRGRGACRLLRDLGRAARYGAEPCHAGPDAGRDGASRPTQRGRHPRREGEGPAQCAPDRPRGCRAGTVHRGRGRGHRGAGYRAGGGSLPHLDHGNVPRAPTPDRELAVAERSVLRPDRASVSRPRRAGWS